ncbi:transposase, partial [Specibacter cremeus]|uniref:transposase n=1 Tax=Specibacter cremeus TaxID=1629051 RepID=UPI0013DE7157
DAVRLRPDDDETTVTAAQVREVVARLREAGHWVDGDPEILLVFDAGYELARLAFLLDDLPVQVLGRMRADRVLCFPAPPPGRTGRPRRHGAEFRFADPASWPEPETVTSTGTDRYGQAVAAAWPGLHPKLTHRGAWAGQPGPPPI